MRKSCFLLKTLIIVFAISSCQTDTSNADTQKETEQKTLASKDFQGGAKALSPQDPFVKKYIGNIGEKNPIDMQLVNWGDGFLTGNFAYQKDKKPIELHGEMQLNETVELQAYVDNVVVDKFVFPFSNLNHISGKWTNLLKGESHDFELQEVASKESDKWSGQWHLNGIWEGGDLIIGDVQDSTFYFALSFNRNAHVGEIEGAARLTGDTSAVFKQALDYFMEVDEKEEEEPCDIYFSLKKDHIEVHQRSSNFACGFGMRAYASGRYDNKIIKEEPTLAFGDSGVFVSADQHDQFKTWIGEEAYRQIAFNMHMIQSSELKSEAEDLQGILTQGLVMGMLTSNEAIILHDGQSAFWAATIAFLKDENNTAVIRYFTNQKKWKKKLPQAFEQWRASFIDYEVLYEE